MVKEGICLSSFIKYIKFNSFFKIINAFLIQQRLPIIIQSCAFSIVMSKVVFLVARNAIKVCQRVCDFVKSQKSGFIVSSLLLHKAHTYVNFRYFLTREHSHYFFFVGLL